MTKIEFGTGVQVANLISKMKDMKPDERMKIINEITSVFCPYCGDNHEDDPMPCQCWNDG